MSEHGHDEFSISDAPTGEMTVVSVTGEVDMDTGPAFQRGLLRALGAGRGGLIVDLSDATFMDSGALTSLVNAFDDLRRRARGNLVIVATDPRMRALFDVARLERDFEIFGSRADALASYEARSALS
jgi:anti-sigma B factor antagonist